MKSLYIEVARAYLSRKRVIQEYDNMTHGLNSEKGVNCILELVSEFLVLVLLNFRVT
jgi:hypothetical protein